MKSKIKIFVLITTIISLLAIPISVNAFSIQSYISVASEYPEYVGYNMTNQYVDYTRYWYNNNTLNEQNYVIYRNAVVSGDNRYDLIIYPFRCTIDAVVLSNLTPHLHTVGNGYAGYKLVITEHVDSGIGNAIEWTGMVGFAGLDAVEYVIIPDKIDKTKPMSHIGKWIEETRNSYGYQYTGIVYGFSYGDEATYDYNAIYTEMTIPKTGYTFYYGANGSNYGMVMSFNEQKDYIESTWPKYNVDYIDVVDSTDGTIIGNQTKSVGYQDSTRGFDIGSNTADNAYYYNYRLISDTSATVTGDGITVYRIFEECLKDISGNIYWADKNDFLGIRPSEVTINLYQNGVLYKQVTLSTDAKTTYSFNDLPIYSYSDGSEYIYTIEEVFDAKYSQNGSTHDAYNITSNEYDFINILQFPENDVAIMTQHHTDVIVKTNTEEKIPITLTQLETFIDNELNVSYGQMTNYEIKIFTNSLGEFIRNIEPGKYKILTSSEYTLKDITISQENGIELVKENDSWYLIVNSTPKEGFGIIEIEIEKITVNYQNKEKINNYFKV